jgi:hypothetical protein
VVDSLEHRVPIISPPEHRRRGLPYLHGHHLPGEDREIMEEVALLSPGAGVNRAAAERCSEGVAEVADANRQGSAGPWLRGG